MLISSNANKWEIAIPDDVQFDADTLRVKFPEKLDDETAKIIAPLRDKPIAAKKDLALAALDVESDVENVDLKSSLEELKKRLEVLLGSQPEAPVVEKMKERSPRNSTCRAATASLPPVGNCWEPRSSCWAKW